MCNPVGFTAQELISNLPALCTSTITNAAYKFAEDKKKDDGDKTDNSGC